MPFLVQKSKKTLKLAFFRSMCRRAPSMYEWVPVFKRSPQAVPWQGLVKRADYFFSAPFRFPEAYGGGLIFGPPFLLEWASNKRPPYRPTGNRTIQNNPAFLAAPPRGQVEGAF